MKCPQCGHDADMHWYPNCPGAVGVEFFEDQEYITTACRMCLPLKLYMTQWYEGNLILKGVCCMPKDSIEYLTSEDWS